MKTHYHLIYFGVFFLCFMLAALSKRLTHPKVKVFFVPFFFVFVGIPIGILDHVDTVNGWKDTAFSGAIASDVVSSHNMHRYVVTGEEPASFLDELGAMKTFKAGQSVRKQKGSREVELIAGVQPPG